MSISFYSRRQPFIDINTSTYDVLDVDRGGTGLSLYYAGDILYADGYNSLATLPAGNDGYILTMSGGFPQWSSGGGSGAGTVNSGIAGRLALYPVTGTAVDDTYTQNANLINVEINPHPSLSSTRSYTIPNSGADAYFVMTEGFQTIDGLKSFRSFATGSAMNVINTDNTIAIEFRPGGSGQRNTFIGIDTGATVTSGTENTALGNLALQNVTSGSQNTAIGNRALFQNDADRNVAVGHNALEDNSTGTAGVAVGTAALSNNTIGVRNTALGYASLGANTDGNDNTAVGAETLAVMNNNPGNVAVGNYAMALGVSGDYNTAIGYYAMRSGNGITGNTAVGAYALTSATSSEFTTAIGFRALEALTSADGNTAVGYQSGIIISSGLENTSLGAYTLHATTTGSHNVAIGAYAANGLIDGNDNIAIGYQTLASIGGGERNVAIGTSALGAVDTQADNVAVGYFALRNNDDALNTAVGSYALETNAAGIGNTALGYHAGRTTTGSRGVFIGREAGYSETEDDKLHIANSQSATLIYGDFVDGYVGINDTSPQHSFSVTGDGYISQDLHLGIALDEIYGGTGKSSYATGDILYADSISSLASLPIEIDGYVLTTSGGVPNWESLSDLTSAITITLDDEDEVVIPNNATWGFVLVGDNEEYAHFTVNDDASTINLVNYSINVSTSDIDGFFVIYNNGSGLTFKNRLGSTKTVTYNLSNTAGGTGCSCSGDIVCTSLFADGYGGGVKDPDAIIQMDSTTQGFLPPRMTTVQRNAITTPPEGLIVYDLDLHKLAYFNGTSWVQI